MAFRIEKRDDFVYNLIRESDGKIIATGRSTELKIKRKILELKLYKDEQNEKNKR